MNRRLFAALAVATALLLTGCSSPTAEPPSSGSSSAPAAEETPTPEPVVPLDLAGEWKQTNSASPTAYQTATITADTLTINWINEEQDMTSLYWLGTFPAPTEDVDTYTWTSQGDVETMASQLLASQSETKDFTYEGGVLKYELQALGETMQVEMSRQ